MPRRPSWLRPGGRRQRPGHAVAGRGRAGPTDRRSSGPRVRRPAPFLLLHRGVPRRRRDRHHPAPPPAGRGVVSLRAWPRRGAARDRAAAAPRPGRGGRGRRGRWAAGPASRSTSGSRSTTRASSRRRSASRSAGRSRSSSTTTTRSTTSGSSATRRPIVRHATGTEPHHGLRPTEVSIDALATVTTTVTFTAPGDVPLRLPPARPRGVRDGRDGDGHPLTDGQTPAVGTAGVWPLLRRRRSGAGAARWELGHEDRVDDRLVADVGAEVDVQLAVADVDLERTVERDVATRRLGRRRRGTG